MRSFRVGPTQTVTPTHMGGFCHWVNKRTMRWTLTEVKLEDIYVTKVDEIHDDWFGSATCGPHSGVSYLWNSKMLSQQRERIQTHLLYYIVLKKSIYIYTHTHACGERDVCYNASTWMHFFVLQKTKSIKSQKSLSIWFLLIGIQSKCYMHPFESVDAS